MQLDREQIQAYFGSLKNAARTLNIPWSTFQGRLAREGFIEAEIVKPAFRVYEDGVVEQIDIPRTYELEAKKAAAQQGYAPEFDLVHPVPEGMVSKGVSTLYGDNGEVKQQWSKTRIAGQLPEESIRIPGPRTISKVSSLYDTQGKISQQWVSEKPADVAKEQAWRAYADALIKELPKEPFVEVPSVSDEDLMVVIPVGDSHLGGLSWKEETGFDYDLEIAEEVHNRAFNYLMTSVPSAGTCVLAFLGDTLHYDSFETVTPAHKNLLDSDTRYPKLVKTAVRTVRSAINKARSCFPKVHVIIEIGNHDPSSAVFLAICIDAIYENDERVTVDTSPMHYHYFRFGKCLLGVHHGHGTKMDNLPLIMAHDRAEDWGVTKHRKWLTGHIHHGSMKDYVGVTCESFRILAPADAYAAQKGYRSQQDMQALVYHKEYGEVGRHIVKPEMFGM